MNERTKKSYSEIRNCLLNNLDGIVFITTNVIAFNFQTKKMSKFRENDKGKYYTYPLYRAYTTLSSTICYKNKTFNIT